MMDGKMMWDGREDEGNRLKSKAGGWGADAWDACYGSKMKKIIWILLIALTVSVLVYVVVIASRYFIFRNECHQYQKMAGTNVVFCVHEYEGCKITLNDAQARCLFELAERISRLEDVVHEEKTGEMLRKTYGHFMINNVCYDWYGDTLYYRSPQLHLISRAKNMKLGKFQGTIEIIAYTNKVSEEHWRKSLELLGN